MERKLELKDICGYLPYVLKYQGFEESEFIYEIDPSDQNIVFVNSGKYTISQIKPILRPLSDINKSIIHNGKEEVSIVELARIAFPVGNWELKNEVCVSNNLVFVYDEREETKGFCMLNYNYGVPAIIYNQYQLFDYLHSRFIDYRGLIDAGLAVSVYDLENNP